MKLDQLNKLFVKSTEEEKNYLSYFGLPDYSEERLIGSFESINLIRATYGMYFQKDFMFARNCFYKAGMTKIYRHVFFENGKHTSNDIFMNHLGFCYSVISDSDQLINMYLKFEDNFWKTFGSSFSKAIQATIKEDDVELEAQVALLAKYTSAKGWQKKFSGSVNAFNGLLLLDESLVETGINELLAFHHKQDNPAMTMGFFSIEALTMSKLAYRKGIHLNIDNTLIPKEMIPTNELEVYDRYEFFNEILH